ncbi:unnamed protein product [Malus baccata var. baccata]
MIGGMWPQLGSVIASMVFVITIFQRYLPLQLRDHVEGYTQKLVGFVYPYIQITFDEFTNDFRNQSEIYSAIQSYPSTKSSTRATRLKAHDVKDSKSLVLGMDDNEEVIDEFRGIKLSWASRKLPTNQTFSFYISSGNESSTLTILHIINWYSYRGTKWSPVVFEHPATFKTLAMDPQKKEEIINDLTKFREGKEYYAKIGKAWKRGYLLYGPPGTAKSTMIAAMSNLMDYDDNTELRKLLIDSPNNQVTLSGLLNFIDGLWSACKGERLIVFTTNHVEKLDAALTRKGRLDKHIELSYCTFEAFKVLARNYLKLESHHLFPTICELLGETNVVPADVAEHLMPKTPSQSADICLQNLKPKNKQKVSNFEPQIMVPATIFAHLRSTVGGLMFVWAIF